MLVVNIELWPGGDEARKILVGYAEIANVSYLADVSDYAVKIRTQGNSDLGILPDAEDFQIKGHRRRQSVLALLAKVVGKTIEREKQG